jgi:hypothetical protein
MTHLKPLPSPSSPSSPAVVVDRGMAEQVAELLERWEYWLARASHAWVQDCTHTCTYGATENPEELGAVLGLLADHLYARIEQAPLRWR